MAEFDLVVFGGGTGNTVASAAAAERLETALIKKGPLGGFCLNRGCNRSKMHIQHATVLNRIYDAVQFHFGASVEDVEFVKFVREMITELADAAVAKQTNKREEANFTLVQEKTRFVSDHTVEFTDTGETPTAEKVVITAGSQLVVPDAINGLDDVKFLTSDDAIRLEESPDRLVVLGGGR